MSKFKVIVSATDSIKAVAEQMSNTALNNGIFGIAVVVDSNKNVVGTLTDGDIRKFIIKNSDLNSSIESTFNKNPVCVLFSSNKREMHAQAIRQISQRQQLNKNFSVNKIVVLNGDGTFNDVVLLGDLTDDVLSKTVSVYGMGFVGLTLGLVMCSKGFHVTGVDVSKAVIDRLKNNDPHFFENGLKPLLEASNSRSAIEFSSDADSIYSDVYIVAVGTPVDKNNNPNMQYINEATNALSKKIKYGDTVIYRSTLPIGTTRNVIVPILEKSGMKAGEDFYVAFAPERTVEGKAIEEVQSLPQIVGGYSSKCRDVASKIFKEITHSVVEVESLEAAEMVKLLNNTFRDLVFSFANEVSYICEQYNINAFKLIEAANDGYPRNPIPKPSPGVGGICLSKDPHLYTNSSDFNFYKPILGSASREINGNGHIYVYNKLLHYCSMVDKKLENLNILIVGLAFKGMPETSDIRESTALKLIEILPSRGNIYVKDFVVDKEDIDALGVVYVDNIGEAFRDKDVVLFMNNHYLNDKFDTYVCFSSMNKNALVFDGWNLFSGEEIEKINSLNYSTMGYITHR